MLSLTFLLFLGNQGIYPVCSHYKKLPTFPTNPNKSFLDEVLSVLLMLHKSTGKNLGVGKSHVMPEPQTLKIEG